MKRNILQIPIDPDLREKAEKEAEDFGFSSLQEMIRVMLTQMVHKGKTKNINTDDICSKYGINYLGVFWLSLRKIINWVCLSWKI